MILKAFLPFDIKKITLNLELLRRMSNDRNRRKSFKQVVTSQSHRQFELLTSRWNQRGGFIF